MSQKRADFEIDLHPGMDHVHVFIFFNFYCYIHCILLLLCRQQRKSNRRKRNNAAVKLHLDWQWRHVCVEPSVWSLRDSLRRRRNLVPVRRTDVQPGLRVVAAFRICLKSWHLSGLGNSEQLSGTTRLVSFRCVPTTLRNNPTIFMMYEFSFLFRSETYMHNTYHKSQYV